MAHYVPRTRAGSELHAVGGVALTAEPEPSRRGTPLLALGAGPVLLYAGIAVVVVTVTAASALWLPAYPHHLAVTPGRAAWWRVWANWDGGWYLRIAESGYASARRSQSSVAFFPAYPIVVRLGSLITGNAFVAGMLATIASGIAVAVLFAEWLTERLARPGVIASLLALLLYPYAFYLYGTLYADALFIACTIGAFVALERGHPWAAGVIGAVATAARPIGIVVVVGLLARSWELTAPSVTPPMSRRRALAAVSISSLGLIGYCGYLWATRGNPLAFVSAERGWHQAQGLSTWFKTALVTHAYRAHGVDRYVRLFAHPIVMLGALALIPAVVRRFGRAYGLYASLAIVVPAVATKDFFGMGRYVLAAFPCFAAAGALLVARPRLAKVALVAGGGLLVLVATQFGRGAYVS